MDDRTLKLSAVMLGASLDASRQLLMMHAEDGEVLMVSPGWLRVTGYSEEEVRPLEAWLRLAHGSAWRIVAAQIARAYGLREPRFGGEYQICTKDGSYRTWDMVTLPLPPLADGRRVVLNIAADTTPAQPEAAQAAGGNQHADAARAALCRFLATTNHELRQPLQAIRILVDTLGNTDLNEQQKQILDYLRSSSNSLGHQLDTLLDIAKLDAGMIRPQAVPISIHSLFWRIESELLPLVRNKGLEFRHFAPERLPCLRTDPNLLLMILRNLVGNAIKYTERGGLLLAARRRRDEVALQVWDTGIGIAAHDLPRIYDEFFQAADAAGHGRKGLGLGLAIVKRLARLLDYELDCRSRLGRGTVVEIRIPVVDLPAETDPLAGLPVPDERLAGLGGRRCIVVDSDILVCKALEFLFAKLGVRASFFASAEEALACDDILTADFYLSDLHPGGAIDGAAFLDQVLARAGRAITGIILAERPDSAASRAGGWKIMRKPPDLGQLLAAIAPATAARR